MSIEKAYENLANAVVEQAANDYLKTLCTNYHMGEVKKSPELVELERFFTGQVITMYTKLDGKALMLRLRDWAAEYDYDWEKLKKSRQKTTKNKENMEAES